MTAQRAQHRAHAALHEELRRGHAELRLRRYELLLDKARVLRRLGQTDAALAALGAGADFAVCAIENSIDGAVTTTMDALAATENARIVGEIELTIAFAVMTRQGHKLDDALRLATHPVAHQQVKRWVATHAPRAEFIPAPSNAAAAKMVADGAADVAWLKRKVDAGASSAITQFFFEPDTFFRFRDRCAAAGIDAEITPGILPVVNFAQARKFAQSCNASVPDWMERLFEGLDDLPDARQLVAAAVAGELCRKLYAGGVRGFHFYTLNRAELAYALCHLMGKRPAGAFSPALEQAA